MKLSFRFFPKLTSLQMDIVEELCFHTTKLYNIANYECITNGYKSYYDMEKLHTTCWHKAFLHSHTYQQCLKVLEQDWKSYFAAAADYKNNPQKYKAMPKPPKYNNMENHKNQIIFTNPAVRFKNNMLMLSLAKEVQARFGVESLNFEVSDKLQKLMNLDSIQQVKIKYDHSQKQWYIIIIYKAETTSQTTGNNVMAVDLGLDNLCAVTFRDNPGQYLIDGRRLKAKNSYFNKQIAYYTSLEMKKSGNTRFKRTARIRKLQKQRNDYIQDCLHKASRKLIEMALLNNCSTIVIGDISGIKQESPIEGFVQIPIQRLVEQIKYKAEIVGIEVVLQEESYTSGVSAIDLEPVDKVHYNKNRRIARGLFKSNEGFLINADINGSLNILRKYKNVVPELVIQVRDNGLVDNPIRIAA
ncbi:MAG TPA: transposase [Clostridia bacterium]|nr:transposase [Clostridia bacterium]